MRKMTNYFSVKTMKNLLVIILFVMGNLIYAQPDSLNQYQNSIFPSFKPFSTPRTNGRPGTVYRVDKYSTTYYVQDVKMLTAHKSEEGDIVGRMVFTSDQLLQMLNIEFASDQPILAEVFVSKALREYNEQTQVDDVLWEKGHVEKLIADEFSNYYLVRETISTKNIAFRFNQEAYDKIITGAAQLTKLKGKKGVLPDFPYEISKKWKEPRRVFYLDQEIGLEPYPEEEEE